MFERWELHRLLGDEQLAGDVEVGPAFGDQCQSGALAVGQTSEGCSWRRVGGDLAARVVLPDNLGAVPRDGGRR